MLSIYKASAGSGKTFTIVKDFLKVLFTNHNNKDYFSKILAVTFTNKASIEMKNRILNSLVEFCKKDVSQNQLFLSLNNEIGISEIEIKIRSKKILEEILHKYSLFSISTIDKFTYRLMKVFSKDLNLNSNFSAEIDDKKLINEAIDIFISKLEDNNNELNFIIKEFIKQKLNNISSWDITYDIKKISLDILGKEDSFENLKNIENISNVDFLNLIKKLNKKIIDFNKILKNKTEKINTIFKINNIASEDLHYKSGNSLYSVIQKIEKKIYHEINFNNSRMESYIENRKLFSKENYFQNISDEIYYLFMEMKEYFEKNIDDYFLKSSILKNIYFFAIFKEIKKELENIKKEKNIVFLSEFNNLIKESIKDEPIPFIYERLGEKYKHFFIDEFQDTSVFQWENIKPLLDNQLSQNGTAIIVGDSKQSIYRWRGGDTEQFINLTSQEKLYNNGNIKKVVNNLPTNFRSAKNIVEFCNIFFRNSSYLLSNEKFKNIYIEENNQNFKKQNDGFINIKILEKKGSDDFENYQDDEDNYEKEDFILYEVLKRVEKLLENGWQKKDICILVRKNSQGVAVSKILEKNNINILSSETLLLNNSNEVNFLIYFLKFIFNPKEENIRFDLINEFYKKDLLKKELYYYHKNLNDDKFFFNFIRELLDIKNEKVLLEKNIYDLVCLLIKKLDFNIEDNYISFFLDDILDFSINKKSDIGSFLDYWESSGNTKSISFSGDIDAVKVMTIHKSKGLEFPVVIIPFTEDSKNKNEYFWKDINEGNINNFYFYEESKMKKNTHFENIISKIEELKDFDNINIHYVAFTRAKEELYIISTKSKNNKDYKIKNKLINYFFENNNISIEEEYKLGSEKIVKYENNIDAKIEYKISKDSKYWNYKVKLSYEHMKNISLYGDIFHKCLSKIKYYKDKNKIEIFLASCYEINEIQKNRIKYLINLILNDDKLKRYYEEDYKILNERSILINGEIIRPDRISIKDNKITIIEYKTGAKNEEHKEQILNYANSLSKKYCIEKLILIYINENYEIVEINF